MIWLFGTIALLIAFVAIMALRETELSHRPLTEEEIAEMLEEYADPNNK